MGFLSHILIMLTQQKVLMQLGALEIDMQLESILGGESSEQVWNVCVILTCYIDNTNTRDNKMESISWECLVNTLRERKTSMGCIIHIGKLCRYECPKSVSYGTLGGLV